MFRIRSQEELAAHIAERGDLSFAKLEGLDFSCRLDHSLADTTVVGCCFAAGTIMPEDLSDALFVDCVMTDLRFVSATLFGARFIRCDLSGSHFHSCDLSAAAFVDCAMESTRLTECDVDAAMMPNFGGNAPTRPNRVII